MDFEHLRGLGAAALYTTTFVFALVSGLVPYVLSLEVYLVAVSALTNAPLVPIVGLSALGQAISKYILYLVGKGTLNVSWVKRGAVGKAAEVFARHPHGSLGIVATSAACAVPPLYPVSLVAGTIGVPRVAFVVIVALGVLVRYTALFLASDLFRSIF